VVVCAQVLVAQVIGEHRVERRLAAILCADVAGYSRLMGNDEEGTLARLKRLRREVTDPKIEQHHGHIVKTTGDGILVEFVSVVEAVQCAVEVQQDIAERNAEVPIEQRIELRTGINLGDIIIDGSDIYGDSVNVAARLEGVAEPGGVCVSGTVYEHVRDKLPYRFTDLGEQQVKNIERPIRVYSLPATSFVPSGTLRAPAMAAERDRRASHLSPEGRDAGRRTDHRARRARRRAMRALRRDHGEDAGDAGAEAGREDRD
jgi:adenylate cyclase